MRSPYKIDPDGNVTWLRKEGNLKGAPEIIEGKFDCSHCDIRSLEGGPTIVKGDYYCNHNPNLKSIKGAPYVVGGNFSCLLCDIRSLEGGPKIVKGNYICSNNPNLTSLEGAPEIIEGEFECAFCDLRTLEGGPRIVKGDYYLYSGNYNFKSLKGIGQASSYDLPDGFTMKDVEKELERQKLFKDDPETEEVFGDIFRGL